MIFQKIFQNSLRVFFVGILTSVGSGSRITKRLLQTIMIAAFFAPVFAIASGFFSIQLDVLSTYRTGPFDEDASEIVAYDHNTKRLFTTNAYENAIDVYNIASPEEPQFEFAIPLSSYGIRPNSVAVNRGIVAVATTVNLLNANVVFFDVDGQHLKTVEVGPTPDMLTFTPNGKYVLVANEGVPNDDYSIDPEGSISIIDLSYGVRRATETKAGFEAFNDGIEELRQSGVRIFGPGATVAQDLEPEFIAVSHNSRTAWVTLQENNALAVLDIKRGKVTAVLPLGFKDHNVNGNGLDASDRDGEYQIGQINIAKWPVFGMYQPDGIASYRFRGKTFLVTANEGDARDYKRGPEDPGPGLREESSLRDMMKYGILDLNAFDSEELDVLQLNENLGRLELTNQTGDIDGDGKIEQLYSFGGRSFSIWTIVRKNEASEGILKLVFDSGDEFEQIIARAFPGCEPCIAPLSCTEIQSAYCYFNVDYDENTFDKKSKNQGPQPQGVAIGRFLGRIYAFITIGRVGGIMVYDITDPYHPAFVEYANNRNFDADPQENPEEAGDLGPEGVLFIPPGKSPVGMPLVVVANEKSGTTTIYRVTANRRQSRHERWVR